MCAPALLAPNAGAKYECIARGICCDVELHVESTGGSESARRQRRQANAPGDAEGINPEVISTQRHRVKPAVHLHCQVHFDVQGPVKGDNGQSRPSVPKFEARRERRQSRANSRDPLSDFGGIARVRRTKRNGPDHASDGNDLADRYMTPGHTRSSVPPRRPPLRAVLRRCCLMLRGSMG